MLLILIQTSVNESVSSLKHWGNGNVSLDEQHSTEESLPGRTYLDPHTAGNLHRQLRLVKPGTVKNQIQFSYAACILQRLTSSRYSRS